MDSTTGKCESCRIVQKYNPFFKSVLGKNSGKVCKAKGCEKTFPNKESHDQHWDQEHSEILLKKCRFCDFEDRKRQIVEEHMCQNHSDKPVLEALTCPKCEDFHSTDEGLIKLHLLESCPAAGKGLRVMNTSPTKLVISKKSFVCHLCSFKTDGGEELGQHLVQEHLHSCTHCDLKAVSQDFIDQHVSDSHSELIIKTEPQDIATGNTFRGTRKIILNSLFAL